MWGNRLFLVIGGGAIAVLAIVCVIVYSVVGFGSPEVGAEEPAISHAGRSPGAGGREGSPNNSTNAGGKDGHAGGPSSPTNGTGRPRGVADPHYQKVVRISRRPKPEDLDELKTAASTPNWRTREAAMVGIGRLGKDSDPAVLIDALRRDPSAEVRAAAAGALGRLKHWDAGPVLIDALDDPDLIVRGRAYAAVKAIMGVDFHYRANDPRGRRGQAIQQIRAWWPKFYEGHLQSKPRGTDR